MRDRDLYSKILGLPEPWLVVDVELDLSGKSVVVRLGRQEGAPLACPECGRACPGYDSQPVAGGIWTPASFRQSSKLTCRVVRARSMGSNKSKCRGRSPVVVSRRCWNGWRSTGCRKLAARPPLASLA